MKRLRVLFDAASEQDPAQRDQFLTGACGDDLELRAAVDELLAAHEGKGAWIDRAVPEDRWVGKQLGPYRIVRHIGSGGMAAVYLAERDIGRVRQQVALKLIRPSLLTNAQMRGRFEHEREILASLDHLNIARLLDIGSTPDGVPYLVMEYVEGDPLDAYCQERQLSIPERLELFCRACDVVDYTHSKGVIHRDLKPGNILVALDRTVKLLDFGIAKVLHQDERLASTLTRSGASPMTILYASPEQVRGAEVSPRTDVYSLGVMLYELLAGAHPWRKEGQAIHAIASAICDEQPVAPSVAASPELRPQLTGDLDSILLKALRKEPEWRYESPGEFAADIRRHLAGERVLARNETLQYRAERLMRRILHPTGSVFHTQGMMLCTAGLLGVLFLLERHQIFTTGKPAVNYGRNAVLLGVWLMWAAWEGRRMIRMGRFSALDRQSWIVFSVITVMLGVVTILADVRGLAAPEPLAVVWIVGLAIGLTIVGLQANRVLTGAGIVLFLSAIAAVLDPQLLYVWLAVGLATGMVGPGIWLAVQRFRNQELS